MRRVALCVLAIALFSLAASSKDAVDFSGTYSAKVKYDDGTTGTQTIRITQTSNSVQIETVGSKNAPIVYKFGEPVFVTDSQGKSRRELAVISGRTLRIDREFRSPPDAITGTEQTTYTLSKDGNRLMRTFHMAVDGPTDWGNVFSDTFMRVVDPKPPAK